MRAKDEFEGKTVKCRQCQEPLQITRGSASKRRRDSEYEHEEDYGGDEDDYDWEPQRQKQRRRKKSRKKKPPRWLVPAIGSVVGIVLVGTIAFVVVSLLPESGDQADTASATSASEDGPAQSAVDGSEDRTPRSIGGYTIAIPADAPDRPPFTSNNSGVHGKMTEWHLDSGDVLVFDMKYSEGSSAPRANARTSLDSLKLFVATQTSKGGQIIDAPREVTVADLQMARALVRQTNPDLHYALAYALRSGSREILIVSTTVKDPSSDAFRTVESIIQSFKAED